MTQPSSAPLPLNLDALLCARCGAALAGELLYCTVCGTAAPTALRGLAGGGQDAAEAAPAWEDAGLAALSDHLTVEEALGSHSVFSLLPPMPRQLLAISCFRRRYLRGEWPAQEGHSGERAFLIGSGEAQLSARTGRGRRVLIRTLRAGDFFGEPALLTGAPRTMGVQATSALEAFVFPQEALAELARDYPIFGDALRRRLHVATLEAFLRRASPFAPLEPNLLFNLADHLDEVSYPPGAAIFDEGDEGDAFYLVRHGSVEVVIGGRRVATLSVGDCFGEAALLSNIPRTATIRVLEQANLLRLSQADFRRVIEYHPLVFGFFVELQRRRNLPGPSQEALAAARRTQERHSVRETPVDLSRAAAAWQAASALAAMIALLSSSSHGAYLAGPSAAAALAAAPVTAAAMTRAPWMRLQTTARSLALAGLLGMVAGLALGALPLIPAAAAFEGAATALALAAIVRGSAGRRGRLIEMDDLAAGVAAGVALGVVAAGMHWLAGVEAGRPALTLPGWFELLTAPARAGLAGALVGSAVWRLSGRKLTPRLAWPFALAAGLLALGRVAVALDLPPIPAVMGAAAALAGLLTAARKRVQEAVRSRTVTLATLGLASPLLGRLGSEPQVTCRACDTPATAGEVYCARCGQSLLDE